MSQPSLLAQYEDLASTMHQMLEAARQGRWDTFDYLQSCYDTFIALLKARGPYPALSADERLRKVAIVRAMLADDRELQAIAESLASQ
ncbi:flagellar protein FliT [Noviherbaspirillum pedocola]|uniref:Flagellar protein FliT n=1 Tax=Noviherbaspirillum pedocola TaxID=2801341 RepID=A0A934SW22_9BURK|nr:flagellar protein FliT [Noviherbaspirillum pedocola]MBK4736176.1 flagellar protein FliT [Noviherbaspirillum pedocola]